MGHLQADGKAANAGEPGPASPHSWPGTGPRGSHPHLAEGTQAGQRRPRAAHGPRPHLGAGCAARGAARPAAPTPGPAAARTGPTARPPAGTGPGRPADSPASHVPGGEGGVQGRLCSVCADVLGARPPLGKVPGTIQIPWANRDRRTFNWAFPLAPPGEGLTTSPGTSEWPQNGRHFRP